MSEKILKIVRGLSQAASDLGYDGAVDDEGAPVEIGLNREEGRPMHDARSLDGFGVRISGSTVILSYHSDIKLRDLYSQDLENEVEQKMSKVVSALKKRYKALTKETLSLKEKGPADVRAEKASNVRYWITARKLYTCGGLDGVVDVKEPSKLSLEKDFESFLNQGGWGASKRPKNDSRKASES
tara:strand:+ start:10086 stop:10637 length:552 start_codon:yes stop_codon:yes gene_type:complete